MGPESSFPNGIYDQNDAISRTTASRAVNNFSIFHFVGKRAEPRGSTRLQLALRTDTFQHDVNRRPLHHPPAWLSLGRPQPY